MKPYWFGERKCDNVTNIIMLSQFVFQQDVLESKRKYNIVGVNIKHQFYNM